MIAFVHGMAVDMTESSVVVEAGGIGYEIYMTGADLSVRGVFTCFRCLYRFIK